jgi:hypothetical protein
VLLAGGYDVGIDVAPFHWGETFPRHRNQHKLARLSRMETEKSDFS